MSTSLTQTTSIEYAGPKLATAAGAGLFGVTWGDWAAIAAFTYTCLLIAEWLWKKAIRPFAEQQGWVARPKRRKDDREHERPES